MESEVFEITFRKKVSGSILNHALLETQKRYPYLNTKLVELDGDFYIIDRAGFYNSGAAGLGVNIVSCGEKFCFNFKQSFESDKYVKAFLAELNALGISYHASEAIPFLTPNDEIIKRTKGEVV